MIALSLLFALAQDATEPASGDAEAAGPDRSTAPAVRDPEPVDLDELSRIEIRPGLTLHHVRVARVRDVRVQITWRRGYAGVDVDPAAVRLTSSLWGSATEQYDEGELAALKDTLDLSLATRIGPYSTKASIEVPLDDLDAGWEILDQVVHRPVFDKRVLKRTQEELYRHYVTNGPTDPRTLLWATLDHVRYTPAHPDGWRPDVEAFEAVKVKALPPILPRFTKGGPVEIVVVGDVSLELAEQQVRARFADLGGEGERMAVVPADRTGLHVVAVPLADTEQVSIGHSRTAPALGDEGHLPMEVVGYALGGHFLARFNRNLREEKGWTYGVRAGYGAAPVEGRFQVAVDVPADKLAPAVRELEHELSRLVEAGVTEAEIDSGWRSQLKGYNDTRSTTSDAASVYLSLLDEQRGISDWAADIEGFRNVTVDRTQQVATEVFGGADAVWVFVGPEAALKTGLDELGLQATWVPPADAIIGAFDLP